MDTLGGRLRSKVEGRKKGRHAGVRLFQREMEERAREMEKEGKLLVGFTYPSIHSYLKDKVRPSEDFVRAAADVLGVQYEWLARGVEPATKEEAKERAREDSEALEVLGVRRRFAKATAERVLGALGCEPDRRLAGLPYWVPAAAHAAGRLARSYPKGTRNGLALAEEELGRALGALLGALGIEPRRLHPRDVDRYILSALPVVIPFADYKHRLAQKAEEA